MRGKRPDPTKEHNRDSAINQNANGPAQSRMESGAGQTLNRATEQSLEKLLDLLARLIARRQLSRGAAACKSKHESAAVESSSQSTGGAHG